MGVPLPQRRGTRARQSVPRATAVANEGAAEGEDAGRSAPRRAAPKAKGKAKASSQAAPRALTKSEIDALFVERLKCRAEAIFEDLKVVRTALASPSLPILTCLSQCDYCATYAKTEKECKVAPGATACTACLAAHKGCYWGNASLSGTRPDIGKTSAPSEKVAPAVGARPGELAAPSCPVAAR